jgi:hypothetical protein
LYPSSVHCNDYWSTRVTLETPKIFELLSSLIWKYLSSQNSWILWDPDIRYDPNSYASQSVARIDKDPIFRPRLIAMVSASPYFPFFPSH